MTNNSNWVDLKVFYVESATGNTSLFANGRQQIKLRILVQAIDINHVPVPLSASEQASLQLVKFYGDDVIPFVETHGFGLIDSKRGEWDWTWQRNEKLVFFPTGAAQSSIRPDEAPYTYNLSEHIYYFEAYARTTSNAPLRIGARITRDDGQQFLSRSLSNGDLTLTPVRPPVYGLSDYVFKKVVVNPGIEDGLFYYYFGVFSGGVNIELSEFSMYPQSLYANPYHDLSFASYTGYTDAGSWDVNYEVSEPTWWPVRLKLKPMRGQAVIVSVNVIPLAGRRKLRNTPIGRLSKINAIDIFGNLHVRSIRYQHLLGGDLEII